MYGDQQKFILITGPCFVDDAFEDILFLWKNRVFPKSPNSSLNQIGEMNLDFKRNQISLNTLTHLWADLDVEKVEALATILVRFHMLIPDTSAPTVNNNKKYFVPGILAPFTGIQAANSLQEFRNLTPLIYWFDRSSDPEYREMSGFPTGIFFCKLVTILKDITPEQGTWKLRGMFSDVAVFRVGPEGQVYVYISSKSCAIVMKLACLPNSMPEKPTELIQDVRYWIELGIQVIIQDFVPGLGCSVCVSLAEMNSPLSAWKDWVVWDWYLVIFRWLFVKNMTANTFILMSFTDGSRLILGYMYPYTSRRNRFRKITKRSNN